ncbi:hypothetical protein [Aquirhabdus sp.]|uniref:hypothetical protein n=1 Tax=Aquirhabdus sp. TaxID=2824160 RepID=UPI00396CF50F
MINRIYSGLVLSLSCLVIMPVHAALSTLTNEELAAVEGQSTGVQLGLELRINQVNAGTGNAGALLPACAGNNVVFCRLGVQFNNQPNWLLFKGLNGYINIPNVVLYGADLSQLPTSQGGDPSKLQSAIAINVAFPDATHNTAIQFRNVSYTLGVAVNSNQSFGTLSASDNQNSYLSLVGGNPTPPVYQNTNSAAANYSAAAYDVGKETGVMGVTMNGNLNVGGTLYVFAK